MSMIETKRSSERFWKAKSGRTLKLSTRLPDLRLKFNRWSNSLFAFACRLNFLQHHAMSRHRILCNKSTNSKILTPLQNNVNFCEMLIQVLETRSRRIASSSIIQDKWGNRKQQNWLFFLEDQSSQVFVVKICYRWSEE